MVRNEQVIIVTLSLPNNTEAHQFDHEYQKLMNDGVLKCKYAEALSDGTPYYGDCVPGAAGSALDGDLSMTIGYKKPSVVNGITMTSDNSATADLVLTFEADASNKLWQTHGDLFKRIGKVSPSNPFGAQAGKAFLTLYDDGWRVQRVCAVGQMSCY